MSPNNSRTIHIRTSNNIEDGFWAAHRFNRIQLVGFCPYTRQCVHTQAPRVSRLAEATPQSAFQGRRRREIRPLIAASARPAGHDVIGHASCDITGCIGARSGRTGLVFWSSALRGIEEGFQRTPLSSDKNGSRHGVLATLFLGTYSNAFSFSDWYVFCPNDVGYEVALYEFHKTIFKYGVRSIFRYSIS